MDYEAKNEAEEKAIDDLKEDYASRVAAMTGAEWGDSFDATRGTSSSCAAAAAATASTAGDSNFEGFTHDQLMPRTNYELKANVF